MKEKDAKNLIVESLNSYIESNVPRMKAKLIELEYSKQMLNDTQNKLIKQFEESLDDKRKLHELERTKLENDINKTKRERDELARKLERKEVELSAAEKEICELKSQMKKSASKSKETQLDDLERKVQLKRKERETIKTDLCHVESALEQVKEKLLQVDESNTNEQKILEQEINAKEKEVNQLENNLKENETDLKKQILKLHTELAERMETLSKKSMEIRQVQSEIDEYDVLMERKRREEEYKMLSKFGKVETVSCW